ncbi:MAG TPA: hypothetical protein VF779_09810 [Pyrinomonadaceae bacterium]
MKRKFFSYLAPFLSLTFLLAAAVQGKAQTASAPFAFHPGQSMYIVAYRRLTATITTDTTVATSGREYTDLDLDAERKVRKRIEEWHYFRVAEKLSEADFVFLINLDEGSIEGLAIPLDAYREHFKDNYDLDALRDAAYGRYLVGPLKLATVSRLSDRLVEQFREKLTGSKKAR